MSFIKEFEHLSIPLEAIKSATNNFGASNYIGKGGFGKVYKGELSHHEGRSMVAVKQLDRAFGQGDPEFWKEIMMLSHYKHQNLVSLLGFCDEKGEKLLVYEHASRGSLDHYLSSVDLSWIQRLKICVGAARGLEFLHNPNGTQQRVIHRDIKSSNILLNENWEAKISDFGLSKIGPANQPYTFMVSNVVGTFGYCDPLYMETCMLTKESDVYSLGVVLFEVLCGRLCMDNHGEQSIPLIGLAQQSYENNKLDEIVFNHLKLEIDPRSLKRFTSVAYQCLKRNREERPTMTEIVKQLEITLESQKHPKELHPLGAHGPFQPTQAPIPTPLTGWMSNPPTSSHPTVFGSAIGLGGPSTNPSLDYPSGDSDHMSKRTRVTGITNEVNLPINVLPVSFPGHGQAFNASDDLPKTVARTLNQGSYPMSMDFHPIQQTLLLVGTAVGNIGLWEVGLRENLVSKNFKVWDFSACSMPTRAAMVKDPRVSVNRVIWSPDGSLFGVAYSRHILQIYSYHGGDDARQHLEIDAHIGGVNDLAFSHPNKQLCVITCGDDKTIKVWDAATGAKQYTFEGHGAPVYSVCPHVIENIHFIFSTAVDGKIKAWLYDNMGSRVDYEAPGRGCTTMAYSADGTRLFLCGTGKNGESHIVEWNDREGTVKRMYLGFRERSLGVVQFDTTKNRFLAAGDDSSIKYWDMDNVQLLTSVDADGGLMVSPCIRFNNDGALLAVSAKENGIKILANSDGLRLLRTFENLSYDDASISMKE